ncbi:TPA: hypothetical protein MXV05_000492 [Escherichia coli]|nr:hypothetical protein [Escherichia coli]MBF7950464.1 hypothetical protein [Escherichia coli]HCA6492280.1 hypothetical protein [Escherichia coli]
MMKWIIIVVLLVIS